MQTSTFQPGLISIITPSYNQAAFLEDTLRTILLQDGVEFECLVIDGASTDGSQAVIEGYADRLSWWVSEPDRGQAEAINKGFQRARGEFVAWLNSDDLYLPGAIQTAVTALQKNPALGMVFGDALTIDETGHPLNRLSFGEWGLIDLLKFRVICQPAVFMRRSILDQAGFLDLSYHLMLDHHLWIRMARLASIQHIPQMLAAARQHAGAKNVRQASDFSQEIQRILDWIETEPDLASALEHNRRDILGGARRLQARYYLDGDQPSQALRFYSKAIGYSPGYTLKHWHRIVYSMLSLLGAKKLADRTLRSLSAQRKSRSVPMNLTRDQNWPGQNWPGLNLE